MSIIIHIPCDKSGTLGRVEITRSLDMVFLDYNIEYDQAFEAMGGDVSFCSRALRTWEDNPMGFLCGSGLVPVAQLGAMACGLVRRAIPIVEKTANSSCLKYALGLVDICAKQFPAVRRDISRVYHWKQDLTRAWNSRVSGGRKLGELPAFGEEKLVDAALLCSELVMDYWEHMEWREGWDTPPSQPCVVAELVRNAIASVTFKGSYHHPEGFKGALLTPPLDLVEELVRVARMEAVWAVEILEAPRR